jgi:hypothetical protein
MGFFKMGSSAIDDVIERHDAAAAAREAQSNKVRRFWLKAPGSKNFKKGENTGSIIFLDDSVPVLNEHNIMIDGKWGNEFTCLLNEEGADYCPLCESGDVPYKAAFYPIIDRREYTTRDGTKTYRDQIRLLVAKPTSLKQLRVFQQDLGGSLKGQEFKVTRTGNKEPAIGNVFIPTTKHKKADIEAILSASGVLKEGDGFEAVKFTREKWEELLSPLSVAELEGIVGTKKSETTEEDDVDFS